MENIFETKFGRYFSSSAEHSLANNTLNNLGPFSPPSSNFKILCEVLIQTHISD